MALVAAGCTPEPKETTAAPEATAAPHVTFSDVAKEAGIRFQHSTGAFGKYWMPETMGSGCVWLDYDDDGDADLYLVNGTDWPGHGPGGQTGRLYRNDDGRFTEVTKEAGLAQSFYGMGACAGDYDNDGHVDLFVTALGPDRLYRNLGTGRFEEVAARAGVADPRWGSSCAWVDYDRDGLLDLFICNYVKWSPETDVVCKIRDEKTYCTPEVYEGVPNALYRNLGNGRFKDVAKEAGVAAAGKSLGIAVCDIENDGWPDLAVANDTKANFLYRNLKNGRFEDLANSAGVDRGQDGRARGAMGIDAADFDGTGRDSLVIGNFSNESLSVYQNEGSEFFHDIAPSTGIAQVSKLALTFGILLLDFDNNGWNDIFAATGHVKPQIALVEEAVTYAQPPLVFCNDGKATFREICKDLGPDVGRPRVARGLAAADYDNDGDLDLCMTVNGGAACLFRNNGGGGRSIRLRLEGTKSNRSAIGARAVATAGGRQIAAGLRSGMSYCSQNEAVLHLGVGSAPAAETLELTWPSGRKDTFTAVESGALYALKEGETSLRRVTPPPK